MISIDIDTKLTDRHESTERRRSDRWREREGRGRGRSLEVVLEKNLKLPTLLLAESYSGVPLRGVHLVVSTLHLVEDPVVEGIEVGDVGTE